MSLKAVVVAFSFCILYASAVLEFNHWFQILTNNDLSIFPFFQMDPTPSCRSDSECRYAYSQCDQVTGLCKCKDGFIRTDNNRNCIPEKLYCPSEIVDGQEKVVEPTQLCKADVHDRTKSSCPGDSFCFVYGGVQIDNLNLIGHCCRKPQQGNRLATICPLNKADSQKIGSCPSCGQSVCDQRDSMSCPKDKFECVFVPSKDDGTCCPKACNGNFVAFNSMCFERKKDGDRCENSAQCSPNTNCLMSNENVLKCI